MDLREITALDEEIIYEIEKECFNEKERANKEKIINRIKVFGDCFLLLEHNGLAVGYVGGMKINSKILEDEMYDNPFLHNENGKYQSVFSLCVKEKYRGLGYGKQLMEGIVKKGKEEKLEGIVLTCKDKYISFYESIGFKNLGMSKSCHGGAIWYDMFLQL